MTLEVAVDSGFITKKDLENLIIDTTIMPMNIEFPTDVKLLEKARIEMAKLTKEHEVSLRQNYNLVARKELRKIGGYIYTQNK
jgi:hypothetical protein